MKRRLLIPVLAVFIIQLFIYGQVSAEKYAATTDQIINESKADPVEFGFTAILQGENNYNELCSEILNKTGLLDKSAINSQGGIYTVNAEDDNTTMTAHTVENRLEIQVTAKDKTNYAKLKDALKQILSKSNTEPQYYEYTKCSLDVKDINETYDKINSFLVSKGVKNLNAVKIDDGYSITGFTGSGERIRNMGSFIDMNIAILSYKSGNYIIIGTPEIMAAY